MYVYMNNVIIDKIRNYMNEILNEMHDLTWLTYIVFINDVRSLVWRFFIKNDVRLFTYAFFYM